MLTSFVPRCLEALTVMENVLNMGGYIPQFKERTASFRIKFGLWQTITGLALTALGYLVHCFNQTPASIAKSFTWGQMILNFGLLHANHGVLNTIRGYLEKKGAAPITLAYDFYGRKFLPSLAPHADFQRKAFEMLKDQLDRIEFVTLFPPRILIRH